MTETPLPPPTVYCTNHPSHPAVEHCEVCGRALCGECLWYTAAGQRVCQTHAARAMARGEVVHPPEMYADAVELRASEPAPAAPALAPGAYLANQHDTTALVAAIVGVLTLVLCGTGNQALYCLPLAALVLGLLALSSARQAANPSRARTLSWVGIGTGGAFTFVALLFVMGIMACVLAQFVALSLAPGGRLIVTPVP
jgi:hypothetical protein